MIRVSIKSVRTLNPNSLSASRSNKDFGFAFSFAGVSFLLSSLLSSVLNIPPTLLKALLSSSSSSSSPPASTFVSSSSAIVYMYSGYIYDIIIIGAYHVASIAPLPHVASIAPPRAVRSVPLFRSANCSYLEM